MTIKNLIDKLQQYDENLPICINDYMGFVEALEDNIQVEKKKYRTCPFTDNDEFNYINLKSHEM